MIGLDLGSKYIKICSLHAKADGNYVVYAAMTSSVSGEDKKDNPIILKNKINELAKQVRAKNNETYLSVGGMDLLARDFSMPKTIDAANLSGAVMLEAENVVFESLDNMYADYMLMPDSPEDKNDILFVASPKRHIDQIIESLSTTALSVEGVSIDNIALANAFVEFNEKRAAKESIVLVNIGSEVSNIAIIDKGQLRFIRNVAFGGSDVTAEIANVYEVSLDVAEQLKRQPEIWDSIGVNIKNILKISSSNLLEAIFRSMEYCVSRQKIGKVDRIMLTGGGALIKGMDTFIYDTLGISTDKWNPLNSEKVRGVSNAELGYFIPVALGLALAKGEGNV